MANVNVDSYKDRLVEMRTRLQSDVNQLLGEIPEAVRAPGDISDLPTHPADMDSEMLEGELIAAGNERDLLELVEAALERVEAGKFGHCEECGLEIAPERLDALPFTPHCKSCAEQAQRA